MKVLNVINAFDKKIFLSCGVLMSGNSSSSAFPAHVSAPRSLSQHSFKDAKLNAFFIPSVQTKELASDSDHGSRDFSETDVLSALVCKVQRDMLTPRVFSNLSTDPISDTYCRNKVT